MFGHITLSLAVVAAVLIFPQPDASAAVVDDFNDGNDNGWDHVSPLKDYDAGGTYTFPSGHYRIVGSVSPDPGMVGPARAGSLRMDVDFATFDISVDLVDLAASPIDTDLGLLARVRDVGLGTTDGYGFLYDCGGLLSIVSINDEVDSLLVEKALSLDPALKYRLRFTSNGTSLTGTVVNLANPTIVLETLTCSDPHDPNDLSGAVGVLVYDDSVEGNQIAAGTFDNFLATIPEPTSVTLISLGTLVLSLRRRNW